MSERIAGAAWGPLKGRKIDELEAMPYGHFDREVRKLAPSWKSGGPRASFYRNISRALDSMESSLDDLRSSMDDIGEFARDWELQQ